MRRALLLCGAIALLLPVALEAATLRVPSEYPTIQSAIDAARPGDEVLVAPGTYTDRSTKTLIGPPISGLPSTVTALAFIPAGVTVRSEAGAEQTMLDGVDGTLRGVIIHGGKARDAAAGKSLPEGNVIPTPGPSTLEGFKIVNTSKAIIVGNVRFAIRNNDVGSRLEIYEATTTGVVEGNTTRAFVWCQTTSEEGVIWRDNVFEFTPSVDPSDPAEGGADTYAVPLNCRCNRALWTQNVFRSALSIWSYIGTAVLEVLDNQFFGTASIGSERGILRIAGNSMLSSNYGTGISVNGAGARGVIENNYLSQYVRGMDIGSDLEIRYNTIENCGVGIEGFATDVFVHHNRILNCTGRGINAYRSTLGPIEDNEISGSGSEGLLFWFNYSYPAVRRNVIVNNGGTGLEAPGGIIEDNIIAFNGGDGLRLGGGVVAQPRISDIVSGNTIVRNGGDGLFLGAVSNNSIDHNIVAFNESAGVRCLSDYFPLNVNCNNSYGNGGAEFENYCAGAAGQDGNVSVDPLFCGGNLPEQAPTELLLRSDSPCAPENSGGCGLIGALPVGCGIESSGKVATEPSSWGRIKARFR